MAPGIAELGADVWRGNKRSSERGLKVLGTPIGYPHFIASWAEGRMLAERELLNQLPRLPDLQCAWLLLAMCASPRANHALCTVPPLDIAGYSQAHDDAVWETLQACLGGVASGEADGARKLATLPASLGGLGLAEGWQECPSWRAIADGAGPPVATDRSLGDWPHAPCVAHSQLTLPRAHVATRHVAQRLRAFAPSSWAARGCLVNRHPGRPSHHAVPASHAACVAPPSTPLTPPPFKSVRPLSRMRRARRRLRRPYLGLPSHWALGSASQDRRTGVGETAPGVAPDDRRRLDLVIYGASPMGGALCCDATLVSPLTRTGQPGTVEDDGAMLRVAERRKRAAHPELTSGGPQRLLVIGGPWNEAAQQLVRDLARVRAQRALPALRAAATSAWTRRWWATLAVAVQQAVSSTALGSPCPARQLPGPELDRVLDLAEAAGPSRLPLRP